MRTKTGMILLLILACALAIGGFVAAEELMTLEKALTTAYACNPSMVEARKHADGARGELITARALPNPEVEFELSGFRRDEEGKRAVKLGSFEIRQPFEPLGTYGLKTRIAGNEVSARRESVKTVWAAIYAEVRGVYTQIILDKKRLELADGNLQIYRRFYNQVEERFHSDKALKNDLQRSKIELLRAENGYIVAEKDVKSDMARLNLLLGRGMDASFSIEEDLEEEVLDIELAKITDTALSISPDIKIERLRLDSAMRGLAKEQLSRLPSTFIGFKNMNETYDVDYELVIGASMPLWDLNEGQVRKARALKEAQETRFQAAKRLVAFEVYQAYLDVELYRKQLDLLKKSIEEADELLRLADLRYSEGGIDFINFLDQVKAATETKMRYYEGLFDLSGAISRLERVTYASLRKEGYLK